MDNKILSFLVDFTPLEEVIARSIMLDNFPIKQGCYPYKLQFLEYLLKARGIIREHEFQYSECCSFYVSQLDKYKDRLLISEKHLSVFFTGWLMSKFNSTHEFGNEPLLSIFYKSKIGWCVFLSPGCLKVWSTTPNLLEDNVLNFPIIE